MLIFYDGDSSLGRLLLVLSRRSAGSLEKRSCQNWSPSFAPTLPPRIHASGRVYASCSASLCTPFATSMGIFLMTLSARLSTTDNQREGQEDEIIAMVRASLVDDEANVRAAAAKAFDTLQEHIGARAIDETIPTLLEALRQPGQSSGTALQALKEVMAVCIILN